MKHLLLASAIMAAPVAPACAQSWGYTPPAQAWQPQTPPSMGAFDRAQSNMQQMMQPPRFQEPYQMPTQQYQPPMGCVPVGGMLACR